MWGQNFYLIHIKKRRHTSNENITKLPKVSGLSLASKTQREKNKYIIILYKGLTGKAFSKIPVTVMLTRS